MRIGVVSDTHGELDNLREAVRQLLDRWQVSTLVHLGDECEDLEVLHEFPELDLIQVHGVYCQHYQDPDIVNRLLKEIEGHRFLFTHTDQPHKNDLPGDPDPQVLARQGLVDVVAYGHSHIPDIRKEGNVLWLNPGHLKDNDKKGHDPTYAVVELSSEGGSIYLVNLKSQVVVDSETI